MQPQSIQRRRSVVVEAVEPRQMMAANIFNIVGTSGNDEITVRYTETTSGDILIARVNGNLYQHHTPDVAAISITGLGGNDRITWDDNRRNFRATFPVGIHGNAGNDTIILGGEGRYDPFFLRYTYMNMTGGEGVDRIVMDASLENSVDGDYTEISADYISPYGAVGSTYSEIEQIDFKAPQEGRDLHVKSLNATTAVNVLNNNLNSKLLIGDGDLDKFKGIVNFNGVSGNDSVIINDSKDTGGRVYNIESTKLSFNTGGLVFMNNVDSVNIQGTQGQGTYRVKSTGIGRPVTIQPGKSNDLLEVGGGNYTANIKAPVNFWDDTAGTGTVYINDTGSGSADTINLSGGQFSKPGQPATTWAFARQVSLGTSSSANDITVTPSAGVRFYIDGNNQALGAADKISLKLDPDEIAVRTGLRDSGQYLFANKKPITFQEIETVQGSTNLPTVSVEDRVAMEGHAGETTLNFAVTLSKPMFLPVTVKFDTQSNTAVVDQDFTGVSSAVTFAPGETSKSVAVKVFGDTAIESDESFFVRLSGATHATIGKELGLGAIINDDIASAPS